MTFMEPGEFKPYDVASYDLDPEAAAVALGGLVDAGVLSREEGRAVLEQFETQSVDTQTN